MKRLRQIFQNDNEKFTLRYVAGGIGFSICGIAFILGGFHFYNVDKALFDSFLTGSIALIGAGVIAKFAPKK